MAREKKHRVATDAAPALQAHPFAALEIKGREAAQTGTDTRRALPPPCNPPGERLRPTSAERLLLRRSTAHRGGKTVLVLEGFSPAWNATGLEALLHELKKSLGCGGKVEARTLELQGELADRLIHLLEARGFAIKRGW